MSAATRTGAFRTKIVVAALLVVATACGNGSGTGTATTVSASPSSASPPSLPAAPSVQLGPGVERPETRPAARVLHADDLAPCQGQADGAAATYAPTVLVYEPEGKLRWALCPLQPLGTLLIGVTAGIALVQFTGDQFLGAYDLATGELRWWKPSVDKHARIDETGAVRIHTVSTAADAILDPLTGTEDEQALTPPDVPRFSVRVDGMDVGVVPTGAQPQMSGTAVEGRVVATGKVRWTRSDLGTIPIGGIAAGDGVVAVITADEARDPRAPAGPSTTHILDPATGATRWQAPGATAGPGGIPSETFLPEALPALRAGTVFVVDGDQVEARSTADGTVRWTMAHEGLIRTNEQVQVGAGPAPDAVVTAAMPEDVLTDQFHARDLATGRVLWSALGSDRGLIIAASDKHVVAADLRLFDLHSGHHLAALQVPCLHDPACTLHDSYVQNVALDGTSVVLAVNDFGGA